MVQQRRVTYGRLGRPRKREIKTGERKRDQRKGRTKRRAVREIFNLAGNAGTGKKGRKATPRDKDIKGRVRELLRI